MSKHKLKQFLFGINSNKNDKNGERGEGKEYSVVVLLSGYPYAFYDKTQETYEGFAVDIMRKLFKDLKLKTKITWVSKEDTNFNQTIKDVAAGKYDIGIGNFGTTAERIKLINFTHPLYLTDSSLVYRKGSEISYFALFKNILKIWVKPFSLIFFATIILGFLSYHIKGRYSSRKNVFRWHFWGTIAALLGEPGTVVDQSDVSNKFSIFIGLIVLALTFYMGTYLTALTTKAALKHTDKYDPFDPSITEGIKNKRILVNKGTYYATEVKRHNGIPILKNRNEDGVELLIKNKNIDGYWNDTGYIIKEIEDRPDYQINYSVWSNIESGIGTTSFIVNKKYTTLLRRMNKIILLLHKKRYIEGQCSNWMDARPNKNLCRL